MPCSPNHRLSRWACAGMTQDRAHHVLSWPSDCRFSRDSHGHPLTRARPKRRKVLPVWVVGRDIISPQIQSECQVLPSCGLQPLPAPLRGLDQMCFPPQELPLPQSTTHQSRGPAGQRRGSEEGLRLWDRAMHIFWSLGYLY